MQLGLHAMAIDEMRRPFMPTFWTLRDDHKLEKDQVVEQIWFPGVHSNVGGGYDTTGLSDLALGWMISRVQEKTDLKFNDSEVLETVWPCSACTIYPTSKGGTFSSVRSILPGSFPLARAGLSGLKRLFGGKPAVKIHRINEKVHWSVQERCSWPKSVVDGLGEQRYAPANLGPKITEIAEANAYERQLVDRSRDWTGHCALETAGFECQCRSRGAAAGKSGAQQPPAAA